MRGGRVTDIRQNDSPIPADGVVLSVHGTVADELAGVQVGDPVSIEENLGGGWQGMDFIIGCGPRLVANGRVNGPVDQEGCPAASGRGRPPPPPWARPLVKLRAQDALTLDRGGSSDLVVNGEVQNSPSDGQERLVGDALVLVAK